MMIFEWSDLETLSTYEIRDRESDLCSSLVLCSLEAHPSLLDRILEAQNLDLELALVCQSCRDGNIDGLKDFEIDARGAFENLVDLSCQILVVFVKTF